VATVTLSNPEKKNALNLELLPGCGRRSTSSPRATRGALSCAGGSEAFCAGTTSPRSRRRERRGPVLLPANPFDDMIRAIESFPSPVIAMLNGFAFGGLEMRWRATSGSPPTRRSSG